MMVVDPHGHRMVDLMRTEARFSVLLLVSVGSSQTKHNPLTEGTIVYSCDTNKKDQGHLSGEKSPTLGVDEDSSRQQSTNCTN
jgi:hypothetical protein